MTTALQFANEDASNRVRTEIAQVEPVAQRTFTPSQAVLAKSSGCYHWTPEGRRLYDYSSGVLVANLGHNPKRWMQRFGAYLGWSPNLFDQDPPGTGYAEAVSLTAYNAITQLEAQSSLRLLASMQEQSGGSRMERVMWAASGSEAIQKALWACLHFQPDRDIIIATRHGFHGKKGLAGAVTGSESDPDRDPRVRFISFPKHACDDIHRPSAAFDAAAIESELTKLRDEFGDRLNCLITEPYLGGGGSYHPPIAYHQLLQDFCREHDILFVLDEVQSNFGRTGPMYAYTKYGIEPDIVCLGKGLGNGVPVSAAVGRADVFGSLRYGDASDTWSANPLACAGVLATLDEFETTEVLEHAAMISELFIEGLGRLRETAVIERVRGEGMVFGIECAPLGQLAAEQVANDIVKVAYLGERGGDGIHLLGPLAGKVLRVSPPLTITEEEAQDSQALLHRLCERYVAEGCT